MMENYQNASSSYSLKKDIGAKNSLLSRNHSCKSFEQSLEYRYAPTQIGEAMELKPNQIPPRTRNNSHQREISAFYDTIDDIYREKDPIEASLKQRRVQGGDALAVLPQRNLPFFFTLKVVKKAQ